MIPYGGFSPSISNFSGYLRGHSTHCLTWNLTSSLPPISAQSTLGTSTIMSEILRGFDSRIYASRLDLDMNSTLFLIALRWQFLTICAISELTKPEDALEIISRSSSSI
jgi:hypothetical protein